MLTKIILSIAVLFSFSLAQIPGITPINYPITVTVQPTGSDSLHWASGRYLTQARNGGARVARGFEVSSTSTGGVIKVHLVNDYASNGTSVWLLYTIPASNGNIQRIGLIYDAVDSAGTTIAKADIINWY
jgi:hypothetical protein